MSPFFFFISFFFFFSYAGKVCGGRSRGCGSVDGDKPARAALKCWWSSWRRTQAAEADEPEVPSSSSFFLPSTLRCLRLRSICSTCCFFCIISAVKPRSARHAARRPPASQFKVFPTTLSRSRLPKFVTFLRARVKIVYFLSLNK